MTVYPKNVMATLFLASSVLLGASCGTGNNSSLPEVIQPEATKPQVAKTGEQRPPTLQVARAERDLGPVPLEEHLEVFEIRNLGDEPLVVRELQKSCNCFEVRFEQPTIPPNGMSPLSLTFTPREPEDRSISLTLHSNDPVSPTTRLLLSWRSRGPISVEPMTLDFGLIRPNVPAVRQIRVRHDLQQSPQPHDFKVIGTPSGLLKAERKKAHRTETLVEEDWEITLEVNRETVESHARLLLIDQTEIPPFVQLPVSWQAREEIQVSPPSLFLGSRPVATTVQRTLEITCDPGQTLEIDRVEHQGKLFQVTSQIQKINDQQTELQFEVVFPAQPGTALEQLRVHCRQPQDKVLEIPLSAVVLAPATSAPAQ